MRLSIRFTSPAKTLPGPISSMWLTPDFGHERDGLLPEYRTVDLAH